MTGRQKITSITAAAILVLLLIFTAQAKTAAAAALQLCGTTLLPSLFPFYAAADLLLCSGGIRPGRWAEPVMRRLFGLPGEAAPALLLGLLGGYPIGAAAAAGLYRQGALTKQEAVYASSFCNNAGPAFIIGAAGLAVFHSAAAGLLLYLIHAVSAVLTGLVLRHRQKPSVSIRKKRTAEPVSSADALPEAIRSAVRSMLMICAYVIFFSVVLALLRALAPVRRCIELLSAVFPAAEAFLSGLAELSCGIVLLRGCAPDVSFVTAAVLLGWGGLCVFFQSSAVLSEAGLPSGQCLIGKLLQALFSGALACIVCGLRTQNMLCFLAAALFSVLLLPVVKIRGRKMRSRLI